ncbi:MAG: UdgX family uracil-DNA binding protein [Chloroflexi bacterium]|nr:UdgX family uracil-DNA binding protein [Chloroflexota bacterium]
MPSTASQQLPLPSRTPPCSAADFLPAEQTLDALRRAAAGCRGCELYERASQTVFGEGHGGAQVLLVGEQPGDQEDVQGRPFVGPAGRLLDRALEEAGIDRQQTYVTNAVKHFKWLPRGKRRIHQKPNAREVAACRPWLEAEIAAVRPRVVVALGATAGQSLLGHQFRVTRDRGQLLVSPLAERVLPTIHPSAILRALDDQAREAELAQFIRDLRLVPPLLADR